MKCVQDLYEAKYKTLLKEIKQDVSNWRDIPWSWIGRLRIVKVLILPNLIYTFNLIQIRILASYFVVIKKLILKFIWKFKRVTNIILRKRNKVRGWHYLTQYLLWRYSNQHSLVLWQNIQIDQWQKEERNLDTDIIKLFTKLTPNGPYTEMQNEKL